MRKLTIKEFNEKVNNAHPKEKLKIINYTSYKEDAICMCLNCNSIYTKKAYNFTDLRKKVFVKFVFQPKKEF